MGQQQSQQNNFFWPAKGEVQLWTHSQIKIISEGESKFSEQNNESVITCPIEYSLSWVTKSNQIHFTSTKISNGTKVKFVVDQSNETEYTIVEKLEKQVDEELQPQIMWKCWVEIWLSQTKKNDIVLSKQDSLENVQLESGLGSISNPLVKVYRERRGQLQLLTRHLCYSNQNDNKKSTKYQINMQFCKSQFWIFNWDLKQKIVPDSYFLELQNKSSTESLSFYQLTLN
ncbi:unnamed protein product (macronuclear) [Paramecium tetraurelia]|uniref:Uncharacterized protein n=1 Tax=Paramecium tetraurelia TaxID=5888 RepID=A0CYR8_PARTE|nr:uncharacterized protein GSPATT00011536001 [Paramecium tetraurelia]CAK75935.1 unnamed protein product [Paramecium tetraurelia]|eukprot:XP_001443332.1 hypothetical protein (macronuclear) [Paramecium tetraurelia strain d4-2]